MPYSIHHPDGTLAETAATLDHAQYRARGLSANGGRVVVRDSERRVRGFGERGLWFWGRACRECGGTGRTTGGAWAGWPGGNVLCGRCGGWGAEEDGSGVG